MKTKIIRKQDMTGLLNNLIQEYEVFAPVKRDDLVIFDRIGSDKDVSLEYTNSIKPPKEILFPQSETLFTCGSIGDAASIEVPVSEERPRLLFGIRPCDARSFLLLDKVFNEENHRDVYYLSRRNDMMVIAIGCIKPRATCFCTSVGGGPFSSQGSDLLLVDIGDDYIIQVITDKGSRLVEKVGVADAGENKLALMKMVIQEAELSMSPQIKTDGLKEKLDSAFDDPIWGSLTEKCLSCGICTYLCPSCYCFDIIDEVTDSKGERIRIWDSCQFPLFTLQASGSNPRPTNKERHRQRVMHKFSYCVDNYGQVSCVGCGRCVIECPVNLDIRQVLTTISNR
ncbi:MAG: 4Fe-4S dicluster domain-containing protein [Dehalococcoidales bacterium]|nr:4Fe-4S dicluster domain-containing protein [Dehalococcoidales bacterium]